MPMTPRGGRHGKALSTRVPAQGPGSDRIGQEGRRCRPPAGRERPAEPQLAAAAPHRSWGADRGRAPSERSIRHAWLTELITEVHAASRGTYGVPRVRAELMMGRGVLVGHNAVAMLMHRAGLKGLPGNKRARLRHEAPTAED